MTPEQKEARRISTASGRIHELRNVGKNGKPYIVDKDAGVPYVFISYKSDDWETVLDGIVYTLCKKYGMRAYFDTIFEENSDSWVDQFQPNMERNPCKAVIAFTDQSYAESYATLMEIMVSRLPRNQTKPLVQVLLSHMGEVADDERDENTGLGTQYFKNGTENKNWAKEKDRFDELFRDLCANDSSYGDGTLASTLNLNYKVRSGPYNERTKNGRPYLDKYSCHEIMNKLLPPSTEIKDCGSAEAFADAIYIMLKGDSKAATAFDKDMIDWPDKKPVTPDAGNAAISTKPSERGNPIMANLAAQPSESKLPTLREFLNENTKNTFQKGKYATIALVGTDGFKNYSLKPVAKAKDLVIAFANARIAEMGDAYIQRVTAHENSPKNPIFITQEEYDRRKAGEKEQTQYEKLDCGYYMNKKYGDYDFLANSLKKQVTALDKDGTAKLLDHILVDCAWKDAPNADAPDTIRADTAVKVSGESKAGESVQPSASEFPTLREFLAKHNKDSVKKGTYSSIALVGTPGAEKYSLRPVPKIKDLVIAFANARIAEMGDAYIQCITAHENSPKNPIFITQEEYDRRKVGEKEQTQYEKLKCGYYMNKKYGDYDFLANSLKKQVEALSEKEGIALLDKILVDCTVLQASSGMEVAANALKL